VAALCPSVTTDRGENAAFQCIPRKQENTAIAGGTCYHLNVCAKGRVTFKGVFKRLIKAKDFCFRIILSIMYLYF
jgi:hypothetical protein